MRRPAPRPAGSRTEAPVYASGGVGLPTGSTTASVVEVDVMVESAVMVVVGTAVVVVGTAVVVVVVGGGVVVVVVVGGGVVVVVVGGGVVPPTSKLIN